VLNSVKHSKPLTKRPRRAYIMKKAIPTGLFGLIPQTPLNLINSGDFILPAAIKKIRSRNDKYIEPSSIGEEIIERQNIFKVLLNKKK
jgi:hypothetical protein